VGLLAGRPGVDSNAEQAQRVLAVAEQRQGEGISDGASAPPNIVRAGPELVEEITHIYADVFRSYPFPIHEPDYLLETMRSRVNYCCVLQDGRVAAVASSEMDPDACNVEMTDFATPPEHRGRGLAPHLLPVMEGEMRMLGMCTAHTISRAMSAGMNITFARMG